MDSCANALLRRYEEWSPGSRKRIEEARRWLPGGDTRSLMYCISTPMSELEVDAAIDALRETLAELVPVAGESCPHLLLGS